MNRKIIICGLLLGTLAVGTTGCRKYLDVNQNPNVAQTAQNELLLPSAEIYLASAVGVDMQVNGSLWAQYYTQAPASSQYKKFEQYSPTASDYDRVWSLLYSDALTDLDIIENRDTTRTFKAYVAVAKILKAYSYQLVTDAWGDVPYAEALRALPEKGNITSPAFDPQLTVYNGIIKLLEDSRTIIDGLTDQTISGDLIYGGDMAKWYAFASTLQLKIYLRLSQKSPALAQAGISNLMTTSGGFFLGDGDDALINFTTTSGNQNPLYAEIVGLGRTQNLVASATVVDSMNRNGDPRVGILFTLIGANVIGIQQGNYTLPPSTQVSIPTAITGARANDPASASAPVRFMSSYESYFLQAEAAARYGIGNTTADTLFSEGIDASFNALGLDPADAQDYKDNSYWGTYPQAGSVNQQVRHIVTQKWFSMTGTQGFEAWTEWRRTGYPDFFVVSENSIIGKSAAAFPRRFLYPDVEVTRNQKFPGQKLITDRVYWDIH